jgi:hypothetical protein
MAFNLFHETIVVSAETVKVTESEDGPGFRHVIEHS